MDWDGATYDRVSTPQARWGRAVLERLELEGDETVVDAGCGTGRVTEELLARLPRGRVVALDASPSMLEQAQARLAPAGERARTASSLTWSASARRRLASRHDLGADRGTILRHFLARGLRLAGAGLVLGMLAAVLLTSLIRALLFNVSPTDPMTLALVAGVMAVVAAAACLVPAWRATRVDPIVVLRQA